jgi:mannose-1-phosphate guanylyltransferase
MIPTILCGGTGSRLWPVSRELHPKPFMRMADGQSLLQKAFLRGVSLSRVEEVLTVANRELFFKIDQEFNEVNRARISTSFILEPFGRNTAAAVAAAALQVANGYGGDSIIIVLASDHLITDQSAFTQAVVQAIDLAQRGKLVTFGIKPSSPETGYGYIEADGNTVKRFVEKPSLEDAKSYLQTGRFLWNSGMFCFTAGTILQEMEEHCPGVLMATRKCIGQSYRSEDKGFKQLELNPEYFREVPNISIDYAVMEKSKRTAVVPCDIGWSDIGSWKALSDFAPVDSSGNHVEGEALLHNTENCYINGCERVIGVVGTQNLIIVDTPDALLVSDKSHTQDVKHIFAELKNKGNKTHREHRTVNRPWGNETVLDEGDRYKVKRVVVKPGASFSPQINQHCFIHWVVVNGTAMVHKKNQKIHINTNEAIFMSRSELHKLENSSLINLVMIEIQCGEYFSDDDIQEVNS